MVKYILTQEEQEILEAFESGEIQPIQNANEEIEKHKKYATATFKQDKKINICIASRDLSMIQKLALLEGIPYQTFISSILHKFVDGRYIEKQPNLVGRASVALVIDGVEATSLPTIDNQSNLKFPKLTKSSMNLSGPIQKCGTMNKNRLVFNQKTRVKKSEFSKDF